MRTSLAIPIPPQALLRRVASRVTRVQLGHQHQPWIERLGHVALFEQCTQRQLTRIDRLGTTIDTAPGRVLLREGARAREFYVIIDGHAAVSVAGRMLRTRRPGESFGEVGLLERGVRIATVTAATPMTLLVFTPVEFRQLLDVPPVAVAMMRNHLGRLGVAQALAAKLVATPAAAPDSGEPASNGSPFRSSTTRTSREYLGQIPRVV